MVVDDFGDDEVQELLREGGVEVRFLGEGPQFNVDHMAGVYTDSPYTIPGVSDGGAHTKFFNGGSWSTDYLRWLVVFVVAYASFAMLRSAWQESSSPNSQVLRVQ